VVEGCTALFIADAKGNRWPASIAALDPDLDMALLESAVDPAPEASAPVAFDQVIFRAALPGIDEPVMAVGFPEQGLPRIRPDRRKGQISALSDQGPDRKTPFYLAFKASVRGGNSGGPLFDEAGYVSGMVIAKVNTAAIFQTSGTLVRNTAFAISAPVLMRFLSDHKAPFRLQNDQDVPPAPSGDDGQKAVGRVICQP
jgi:S1-C subfamily serine protease